MIFGSVVFPMALSRQGKRRNSLTNSRLGLEHRIFLYLPGRHGNKNQGSQCISMSGHQVGMVGRSAAGAIIALQLLLEADCCLVGFLWFCRHLGCFGVLLHHLPLREKIQFLTRKWPLNWGKRDKWFHFLGVQTPSLFCVTRWGLFKQFEAIFGQI